LLFCQRDSPFPANRNKQQGNKHHSNITLEWEKPILNPSETPTTPFYYFLPLFATFHLLFSTYLATFYRFFHKYSLSLFFYHFLLFHHLSQNEVELDVFSHSPNGGDEKDGEEDRAREGERGRGKL
jgi:hypothetical protein